MGSHLPSSELRLITWTVEQWPFLSRNLDLCCKPEKSCSFFTQASGVQLMKRCREIFKFFRPGTPGSRSCPPNPPHRSLPETEKEITREPRFSSIFPFTNRPIGCLGYPIAVDKLGPPASSLGCVSSVANLIPAESG